MKASRMQRVVIQIVTFNSEATLAECVRSVKAQTYKNVSLIVIDNASTDRTRRIAKKMIVDCLALPRNLGYAAAHNIGLQRFASEYVLTLNPDVVLDSDFIARLVAEMDEHPEAGSAQPLLYLVERMGKRSDIVDSAGLYMTAFRRQKLRFTGKRLPKRALVKTYIFGPDGAAAFYRRTMLHDIDLGDGIFDEGYFMHKEDVDLCWRAQLRGWKSIFVPAATGYHVRTFRPGKRAPVSAELRMIAIRNRYYLIIKNDLPILWLRDLLFIVLYDLGVLGFVLLREATSIPAYGQLLKNLGFLRIKRMRIQRSRRSSVWYMAKWFLWRGYEAK